MKIDHNIFATAFVLDTLECVQTTNALSIKRACAKKLIDNMSTEGTYKYSQEYPADLDDTACALAALYKYDKKILTGTLIGNFINALVSCEITEGGPYNTWINKEPKWRDIDLAVNINIAYALKLLQVTTPKLEHLIDTAIVQNEFISKYYATEAIVIYFISRFYDGKYKSLLIENIWKRLNIIGNTNNNLFDQILLVNSLLNLKQHNHSLKLYINRIRRLYIYQSQNVYPFIIEKISQGHATYYGNRTITQVLVKRMTILFCAQTPTLGTQPKEMKISREVFRRYNKLTYNFNYKNILGSDLINEIILQPYYFGKSLSVDINTSNLDLFTTLGLANICGWTAYTIYDHLVDKESNGKIGTDLCVANKCLLKLSEIYSSEQAGIFIKNIFYDLSYTMIGTFNSEHIHNSQLYKISCGYLLAPLYVWYKFNTIAKQSKAKNLIQYYKHYLNARQIIDNIHDWKEDQEKQKLDNSSFGKQKINKSKTVKYDFWNMRAPRLLKEAMYNIEKAKDQLAYLEHNEYLSNTLKKLEKAVHDSHITINTTNEFIKSMEFSSP